MADRTGLTCTRLVVYVLWIVCAGILVTFSLMLHQRIADLPNVIDKCVVESTVDVVHKVDGAFADVNAGVAFDKVRGWVEATATKTITSDLGNRPIQKKLLEDIVNGIGRSVFVNMTLRNDLDEVTTQMYQDVHLFAGMVDHEINSIMHGIVEGIGYVRIALLVALIAFGSTAMLHVLLTAMWSAYSAAAYLSCHNSSLSSVALVRAIRFTVLLTAVVTGAIGAAALLIEKYGLAQIPLVQPLVVCNVGEHLYTLGLATAVAAAVQVIISYGEAMLNGNAYSKISKTENMEMASL